MKSFLTNSVRQSVFWMLALLIFPMASLGLGQEAVTDDAKPVEQSTVLGPGDHVRKLMMGDRRRSYIVHVPEGYDPKTPTPVVLALHGAGMNGSMMVWFTGLNKAADSSGFIAVYPSGTGTGPFKTWNSGGMVGKLTEGKADDVAFIGHLLDDLEVSVNVDRNRTYACGLSNGGMMSYRLAVEMPDRIAAIAAVAGTMPIDIAKPTRPVPVLHFHGTKDDIVPYGAPFGNVSPMFKLKGVEDTVETWVKFNGCNETPVADMLSKEGDKTNVARKTYHGGEGGSEVVLVTIEGGGHTWPGRQPPVGFLGKSARNISANDIIWEFFQKHPKE